MSTESIVHFNSHYDVGGQQFANIFQAFDRSIETGQFCYYKLDQNWIDAVQSVKINRQPTSKTLQDLYCRKLKILRNNYKKLVLAYSGGTDSHTILDIAIKNKIYIDEVFIEFPGVMELAKDATVNREQIMALNFAKKHLGKDIGNVKILKWNKQDFEYLDVKEWWKDPRYYQHNKIKVKPCWAVFASEYYKDLDGIFITGHEKPGIRLKNGKFYFWTSDTKSTEHCIIKKSLPFFLDPDITTNYVYKLKSLLQNNKKFFNKFDDRYEFFWHMPSNMSSKKIIDFYNQLGHIFIQKNLKKFIRKPSWGTWHNYKNQKNIQYLKQYEHDSIYVKLVTLWQNIYDTYKSFPYMVQTDGFFVKTVEHYSQMFEITDNSLICRGHVV